MMIRDHLGEEKPPKSTPKNVARVGSGGGLGDVPEGLWTPSEAKEAKRESREVPRVVLGRFRRVTKRFWGVPGIQGNPRWEAKNYTDTFLRQKI